MSSVSLDMKAMVAEDSSDSDQTDCEVAETKVRYEISLIPVFNFN